MPTHTVQQGESLSYLAMRNGLPNYRLIWDHSSNRQLKRRRRDPNRIVAGDRVFIPDRETRDESRGTGRRHRFRRGPARAIWNLCWDPNRPHCGDRVRLEADTNLPDGTQVTIALSARQGNCRNLRDLRVTASSQRISHEWRVRDVGFDGGGIWNCGARDCPSHSSRDHRCGDGVWHCGRRQPPCPGHSRPDHQCRENSGTAWHCGARDCPGNHSERDHRCRNGVWTCGRTQPPCLGHSSPDHHCRYGIVEIEAVSDERDIPGNLAVLRVEPLLEADESTFTATEHWSGYTMNARFKQKIADFMAQVSASLDAIKAWGGYWVNLSSAGITGTAGGCPWAGYRWARATGANLSAPNEYYDGSNWVALPAGFTPSGTNYSAVAFYKSGTTFRACSTSTGTWPGSFQEYAFNGVWHCGCQDPPCPGHSSPDHYCESGRQWSCGAQGCPGTHSRRTDRCDGGRWLCGRQQPACGGHDSPDDRCPSGTEWNCGASDCPGHSRPNDRCRCYAQTRRNWIRDTHDRWTDKFHLRRRDCPSATNTYCCRYDVDVTLSFNRVTTWARGVVALCPGRLRSNASVWFMDSPRIWVAAHETGHHLDNPDEYNNGALDTSVNTDGASNGIDSTTLMGCGSPYLIKKRHYQAFTEMNRRLIRHKYRELYRYDVVDKPAG